MNIILTILIIIISLIALLLIVALFVKKAYVVEREIVIDKPANEVFNYVKYLKNQDYYSKWVMTDPNMKKEFRGSDGSVGFVYAWNGNNKAGEGEQEIKRLLEGQRIDTEVRFIRPFENVAQIYMTTEKVSMNQTKVKWGMMGQSKYPMNITNLFLSGLLGKDLEISLTNLKSLLEKK